jgi:UDP-N-acetylglucosamine acyltransferase
MSRVHPTAIVDPGAVLGADVEVGPFAIVDAGAVVGDRTKIGPRVHLHGVCRIGADNEIRDGAVLGGMPQSVGFDRSDTFLHVGDGNVIGEYVTWHRATHPGGATRVGSGGFFMSYSHLGHDCVVGDRVVMTSFAGCSGHCEIEDAAILSGQAGVHQFVRIGTLAFLGANAGINQDLLPYMMAQGHPARLIGPNLVGMRRAGLSSPVRDAVKRAYKILCHAGLALPAAVARIRGEVPASPEIDHLLAFIEASQRGILRQGE